nr:hypothetical protein [Streptococcus uberis]
MANSNENFYKAIIEIRDRTIYKLQLILMLAACFACIAAAIVSATSYNTNKQIDDLKSELKTKDKQIDGLHGQLRRTQYQLKKASEQNIEQTNKIAELTGNGG